MVERRVFADTAGELLGRRPTWMIDRDIEMTARILSPMLLSAARAGFDIEGHIVRGLRENAAGMVMDTTRGLFERILTTQVIKRDNGVKCQTVAEAESHKDDSKAISGQGLHFMSWLTKEKLR